MITQEEILMTERKRLGFFGLPWTFTKYSITPKKLIIESGFFTSSENEILMYRITDVSYTRTLFQKMFGLGTLTIYSHDKTNPSLTIKNIKNSRDFKEKLSEIVEKDRQRMRMRQTELLESDSIDYDDHF